MPRKGLELGTNSSTEAEVLARDASHAPTGDLTRPSDTYRSWSVGWKTPQTDHRVWSVLQKNVISRLCLQQACQRGICLLTNKAPQAPTHTCRERLWNMMLSLQRRTAYWRERGRPDRKAELLSETSWSPRVWAGRAVPPLIIQEGAQKCRSIRFSTMVKNNRWKHHCDSSQTTWALTRQAIR